MRLGVALLVVGGFVLWRWREATPPTGTLRVQRQLMGTVWNIEVAHGGRAAEASAAIDRAYAEVARVESLMSEWREDSPLSAVNRSAGGAPVEVPGELRAIIERSNQYSAKSGGAFDISWRGMGRLWKLDDSFRVPAPEAVAEAVARVNYRDIRIEGNRVGLARAGMSLGLGAIAKGYGVDRASGVLRQAGFANFLVDGGGDLYLGGDKDGTPWTIGIQHPRAERGQLLGRVRVRNQSLVTSGDYERFRIVDGVRYHHIIDVRNGYPARLCQSVSVMAPSAEQADALATALFVLGPEAGLALAKQEGVQAMIVDAQGQAHFTDGFRAQFVPAQ
jgi:thiamine biosynthesis lipoprotein